MAGPRHTLGNRRGEGDHVMFDGLLNLLDCARRRWLHVRAAAARLPGDNTQLGQRLGCGELHFQPLFEAILVAPDASHCGTGITWDQKRKTSVGFFCSATTSRVGRPRSFKRLRGAHPDNFRMIVVLAQMPQNQSLGGAIKLALQVVTDVRVGKMAVASHHALLDRPGIRADFEHLKIVIGFEKQRLATPQAVLDRLRHIAKICCNRRPSLPPLQSGSPPDQSRRAEW